MKNLFLSKIDLSSFELNHSHLEFIDEKFIIVTKWNWDYSKSHAFQKWAVDFVQNSPKYKVFIFCNHPETFTYGRGLQKPRKGKTLELVDFDPDSGIDLGFPLKKIERGGGLTFHHPGQIIFYPILKLNPKTLSLSKMIDEIFDFSIDILNSWGLDNLSHENKLLGLWRGERKIASMGIAIEKLTTFHGMALNLLENKAMINAMRKINPCGLTPSTYSSVDNFITLPHESIQNFKTLFLQRIQSEWK